jgi:hypothetical protein
MSGAAICARQFSARVTRKWRAEHGITSTSDHDWIDQDNISYTIENCIPIFHLPNLTQSSLPLFTLWYHSLVYKLEWLWVHSSNHFTSHNHIDRIFQVLSVDCNRLEDVLIIRYIWWCLFIRRALSSESGGATLNAVTRESTRNDLKENFPGRILDELTDVDSPLQRFCDRIATHVATSLPISGSENGGQYRSRLHRAKPNCCRVSYIPNTGAVWWQGPRRDQPRTPIFCSTSGTRTTKM